MTSSTPGDATEESKVFRNSSAAGPRKFEGSCTVTIQTCLSLQIASMSPPPLLQKKKSSPHQFGTASASLRTFPKTRHPEEIHAMKPKSSETRDNFMNDVSANRPRHGWDERCLDFGLFFIPADRIVDVKSLERAPRNTRPVQRSRSADGGQGTEGLGSARGVRAIVEDTA